MPGNPMTAESRRRDEGMSLVELLVAMGIFAILMTLVSAFFVNGYSAIRDANALSSVQQDQRNAVLVASSLLRFTDNVTEGDPPGPSIQAATSQSIRFYTNSGVGAINNYPYDVTLRTITSGPNAGVVAEIREPVVSAAGVVTSYVDLPPRVLVRTHPGSEPSLELTYYRRDVVNGVITDVEAPPPAPTQTAAFATWASSVAKVRVRITDSQSGLVAEQLVTLVNPR